MASPRPTGYRRFDLLPAPAFPEAGVLFFDCFAFVAFGPGLGFAFDAAESVGFARCGTGFAARASERS